MHSGLDDAVANVTEVLLRSGMLNNTLLIFSSDNGGEATLGVNWPLRYSILIHKTCSFLFYLNDTFSPAHFGSHKCLITLCIVSLPFFIFPCVFRKINARKLPNARKT